MPDNQPASPKPVRMRSPAYPVFGLSEAIKKARGIWESQRKNDGHVDSVIHAMGYGGRNGASLRAVGALNHYGLIEEAGAKDNRRIRLSELAQDLLLLAEDDKRRAAALKVAALSPTIHSLLWERYQTALPGDGAIKSFLTREKDFSEEAALDVIKNYRDSFGLAKLGEVTEGVSQEEEDGRITDSDAPTKERSHEAREVPDSRDTTSAPSTYTPTAFTSPVTQELPILVDHGQIARIPFPMSEDAFDLLLATLTLWKKRIVTAAPTKASAPLPREEIVPFPVPLSGVWKNGSHEKSVVIVALMKADGFEDFYQTKEGTGIPANEVEFPR